MVRVSSDQNRFGERNGPQFNNADLYQGSALWQLVKGAAELHGEVLGYDLPSEFPSTPLFEREDLKERRTLVSYYEQGDELFKSRRAQLSARSDLKGLDFMEFELQVMWEFWRLLEHYEREFGFRIVYTPYALVRSSGAYPQSYVLATAKSDAGWEKATVHRNFIEACIWTVRTLMRRGDIALRKRRVPDTA